MRKPLFMALGLGLVVFAVTLYFRQPANVAASLTSGEDPAVRDENAAASMLQPTSRSGTPARPMVDDPRLAALMASPADSRIEFVPDADGRVIEEIDTDPGSPGYRKPVRQYTYLNGKLVELTRYRYLGGNQVERSQALVAYHPDGRVDQIQESTRIEQAEGDARN